VRGMQNLTQHFQIIVLSGAGQIIRETRGGGAWGVETV